MSQRHLMEEKGFLLASEVARRIGKQPSTIYRWIDDGKIQAVRVQNRFWYVEKGSLITYLGPEAAGAIDGPWKKAGES